jgi:hypothetical protein
MVRKGRVPVPSHSSTLAADLRNHWTTLLVLISRINRRFEVTFNLSGLRVYQDLRSFLGLLLVPYGFI